MDRIVEKLDGGVLLELESVPDAVAGIDQDPEAQRQIAFRVELEDFLRLLAVDHLEIVLGQVGDEAALVIRDRVQQADPRDVHLDARRLIRLDYRRLGRLPHDRFLPGGPDTGANGGEGREESPDFHMAQL